MICAATKTYFYDKLWIRLYDVGGAHEMTIPLVITILRERWRATIGYLIVFDL